VKIVEIFVQFSSANCYFPQLGLLYFSELCYQKPVCVLPLMKNWLAHS